VPYVPYRDLGDFVIPRGLPARARVVLFADWGTGTPEAYAVLKEALARKPDVLIHLGDIYYSGLPQEVRARFLDPLERAFAELGIDPVPAYTLSGNHDMYSGGAGYYELLGKLGQPASYFCLRNDRWQLLAVDTGLNSGVGADVTFLKDEEVAWVADK